MATTKHNDMRKNKELTRLREISDQYMNDEALSRIELDSDDNPELYEHSRYRERLFVIEYCKDLNGCRAAEAAGYAKGSACVRAHELLKREHVKTAIAQRMRALALSSAVTREWILTELVTTVEELSTGNRDDLVLKLKTLELIAKLMGFTQPELQLNMQTNIESIRVEIVKSKELPENGDQH